VVTTRRSKSRGRSAAGSTSPYCCAASSGAAQPLRTGGRAVQRRVRVAAAFRVARGLIGLRIAIVDDVITTGATVNALAAQLLAAGAARCIAVAAARTPEAAGHQPRNR
jgi:predicted amidophosphoribosyltransferase